LDRIMACEFSHKEVMMSVIASSPVHIPASRGYDIDHAADHAAGAGDAKPSWLWRLVEALAYAGASIDPASALAAQRFARIRDEELRGS
jgi:hypothetical protein